MLISPVNVIYWSGQAVLSPAAGKWYMAYSETRFAFRLFICIPVDLQVSEDLI